MQSLQSMHPLGLVSSAIVFISPWKLGPVISRTPCGQFSTHRLQPAQESLSIVGFFHSVFGILVSGVLAAMEPEGEFVDVIIILAVVIINAVLGVYQESKAEKAIEALQEMSAATSKVIRDGKVQIVHSEDLVVGDVILLEAGDAVPADARILESASLKVEEAALTGESVPVTKFIDIINLSEGQKDVPLGDRKNMMYMGSTVVYGRGKAVITATGMDTEMGKIASLMNAAKEKGQDLVTLCSACHHVIKRVNNDMKNNDDIRTRANNYMQLETPYAGETNVLHFLEVLRDKVGFDTLKEKVVNPLTGKKIGAYYGCLLLRPGDEMGFDDPENPRIIEDFIRAIGAEPIIYAMRNECCGGYCAIENQSYCQKQQIYVTLIIY